MSKIFVGSFDVGFLPGCQMHGDGVGAFVYCFVAAGDEAAATASMKQELEADKYVVKSVDFVDVADNIDWSENESNEDMNAYISAAGAEPGVHFSQFVVYASDEH